MLINPDVLVAAALVILAITSAMLAGAAMPMMAQAGRTLLAYQRLAETLKAQVNPTLAEIMQLIDGLNSLRATLTDNVTQVGRQAYAAADTVSSAAVRATRQSSVLAAGLIAGLKTYLEGHGHTELERK